MSLKSTAQTATKDENDVVAPSATVTATATSTSSSNSSSHQHKHHSATAQLHQVMAGAFSGLITRFITQPCDVLKIRFQLQVEPVSRTRLGSTDAPSKYTSVMQAIKLIHREEGMRAFWKGHNPGQVVSILYGVVQFWSYEQIVLSLSEVPHLKQHEHLTHFVSGAIAGSAAAFFTNPFDVIRTRIVAQDTNAGYTGTLRAFPVIWRTEGIRGYYRGLWPTLIQIGPLVGTNFMCYKLFNDLALKWYTSDGQHLPGMILLLNGGLAGIVSKAAIYPLDFVKKRLQLQGFEKQRQTFGRNQLCNSISDCFRQTLKTEGLLGFYKGMFPTLIKSGLTTALYFSIYDKFKEILYDE